jgi:hypothetical protein
MSSFIAGEGVQAMRRIASLFAVSFLAVQAAPPALADEQVQICFNYGCTARSPISFSGADLKHVQELFEPVRSAEDERAAIARAMSLMYLHAGRQSPVWRDRGGNIDDGRVEGRMDCIDHSTNTTAWLRLLARHGWLRFHDVADRIQRGYFLMVHWSARIVERGGGEYVVDTWFFDPGHPATILPLRKWMRGARPPGAEIFRRIRSSAAPRPLAEPRPMRSEALGAVGGGG